MSEEAEKGRNSFVGTLTLLATLVAMSLLAQFGADFLPAASRLDSYRALWPQKWSLFTNLGGETPAAYGIRSDRHLVPLYGHRVWDQRRVGLRRMDDAQEIETRRIALEVPDAFWQVCGSLESGWCEHALRTELVHTMDNPVEHPRLCGRVGLAIEHVSPLRPHALPDGPRYAFRLAVLELRCP